MSMDHTVVLVGTEEGLYADGTPRALEDRRVDCISVAPEGIWGIVDGSGLWHEPTPREGRIVAELDDETANCLLVTDGRVLVGASGASVFELVGGELVRMRTFDEAPGRLDWYTPWGGPPDIRSMAAGPDGIVYVNVHVGGVVRTTDGGGTWTDTLDIHADVHQVLADPEHPGRAYAATARGLAVTSDGADTWEFTTAGLDHSYCRAVARSDASVFVSASQGPGGGKAALYQLAPGGARLQRCTDGLPEWFSTNLDTFCVGARSGTVVAGDADGTVHVSDDDGATWQVIAQGLPAIRCVAVA